LDGQFDAVICSEVPENVVDDEAELKNLVSVTAK
jgi:hypothetical protein